MLKCSKCGTQNQVGRVFCESCGTKLNLEGMRHEDVQMLVAVPWWKRYWKLLALIPVAIMLLLVCMRIWPKVERIGERGDAAGRMRVVRALARIEAISKGEAPERSADVLLAEADINAYLRYELEARAGARLSVDLLDGVVMVRMVRPRFSWSLPNDYRFEPDLSLDVAYGVNGASFVPYKAWVGHSGAGLSKGRVVRRVSWVFSSRPEVGVLSFADAFEIRNNTLVVKVQRR
jgi:hypothetical protein